MKTERTMFGVLSALLILANSSKAITIIDLSGGPPASGSANGAQLFADDPQPTGTGVFDPFLREQNNDTEYGINTSIAKPPYDDKAGIWTHDLLVSDLATITYKGIDYYEFNLDANQSGNGPISLTTFKIFVTPGSPFTDVNDLTDLVDNGTAAFDLNGAGAVRVDITSNKGSGQGDMFILVPTANIGSSGNLYLYAGFSADAAGAGYPPKAGFEEWSATLGSQNAPDGGSTVLLLGTALASMGWLRRKLAR